MNALFTPPDGDSWMAQAACRSEGINPEWFFPAQENGPSLSTARGVCAGCRVRQSCYDDVMAAEAGKGEGSRHGVYAGLTGNQRAHLYKRAASRARRERAAVEAPAAPAEPKPSRPKLAPCGTRSAYQRHIKKGEPVDDACRKANTDADNRLRRTGSTKRAA
jgi:hypothetical protein